MNHNQIVNALIESLSNTTGETREPADVGRRLAYCQQSCPEGLRECREYDLDDPVEREAWILMMITPGENCLLRSGW